jgi:hypothetical protein
MARKQHSYHYIYKTTCNVTGKFYIGMHSTINLEDGYTGSGIRLRYSIRKYGLENHTKEILEFLNDRESLAKREAEIINEKFLQDPLCLNIQLGGGGGFINEDHMRKCGKAGNDAFKKRLKVDTEFRLYFSNMMKNILSKANKVKPPLFTGKTHSESSKQLMREKAQERLGNKNSQYGTRWITNEIKSKKIFKDEDIPNGWRLGRIIKNKQEITD